MSVFDKRALIEAECRFPSVFVQCDLLGLPRSGFYRGSLSVESAENLSLMRLIDEEYTRHPFYGTRRIAVYLRNLGHRVNRKRVQRLMRVMGLESVLPKPGTSKRALGHKRYPYLLRGLSICAPNQVWCSDITYIRLMGGFAYLTAMMDWYSRLVLSWEVSVTLDESFCVSALETALRRYGAPDICNMDQGSQFTGKAFTGTLQKHGIRISMDGKGRALDNIMIERLWRSVKYEEVYLKEYSAMPELIGGLRAYFSFYNNQRPHQSLDYKTPFEVYSEIAKTPVLSDTREKRKENC